MTGALLFTRFAFRQCEAPAQIKPIVDAYTAATRSHDPEAARKAAGAVILYKALTDAPTDYFLLDRKRDLLDNNTSDGRESSIAWFAALHQKYPNSPAVTRRNWWRLTWLKNHYTFPVLLGARVPEAVSGEGGVAIPQNWFVAPSAELQFLQLGYGADPQWSTTMTAKLQELTKAK